MLGKQRPGSINKYCVLNKYIKSLFEKKNEMEDLYEKNNNIATEQLWDRKLIYILKII